MEANDGWFGEDQKKCECLKPQWKMSKFYLTDNRQRQLTTDIPATAFPTNLNSHTSPKASNPSKSKKALWCDWAQGHLRRFYISKSVFPQNRSTKITQWGQNPLKTPTTPHLLSKLASLHSTGWKLVWFDLRDWKKTAVIELTLSKLNSSKMDCQYENRNARNLTNPLKSGLWNPGLKHLHITKITNVCAKRAFFEAKTLKSSPEKCHWAEMATFELALL